MKIAFYKGKSQNFLNLMQQVGIRIWTLGKYSHVELIDSDDYWYGATSYNPGGTTKRQFEHKVKNWDIIELPTAFNYQPARIFLNSTLDLEYDWRGIIWSQFIPMNNHNPDQYFCSEWAAKALKHVPEIDFHLTKYSFQYSPNSLYREIKAAF